MNTENKWIKIVEYPHTGKTKGFDIINKTGGYPIASICWYVPWRQYCLMMCDDMVFNSACLDLINDFLKEINTKHRKSWKQK